MAQSNMLNKINHINREWAVRPRSVHKNACNHWNMILICVNNIIVLSSDNVHIDEGGSRHLRPSMQCNT